MCRPTNPAGQYVRALTLNVIKGTCCNVGGYEQGFVLVLCQDLVVGFQAVSVKKRGVKKKGISLFTGKIQLLGGYTSNNNVNNTDKHCRERCGCHTGCYLLCFM